MLNRLDHSYWGQSNPCDSAVNNCDFLMKSFQIYHLIWRMLPIVAMAVFMMADLIPAFPLRVETLVAFLG